MSQVPSITTARRSHALESDTRTKRYLMTMGVRMGCFALAIMLPPPWRWIFAVGAVVLPYVAVVLANVGSTRMSRGVDEVVEAPALPEHAAPPVVRDGDATPDDGELPYRTEVREDPDSRRRPEAAA